MGLSGISPGSLLLILLIVIFFMGSSKLRTLGEDLGMAYKGFKKAMQDDDTKTSDMTDINNQNTANKSISQQSNT
jgi:sec-independent protein translocase protein TatA